MINALGNLKIGTRLGLGFAVLLLLLLAVAGGGWWSVMLQHDVASRLVARDFRIANAANQLKTMVVEARRQEKDSFMAIADPTKFEQNLAMWEKNRLAMRAAMQAFEALALEADEREALRRFNADFNTYAEGFDAAVTRIRSGAITSALEANAALKQVKAAVHEMEKLAEEINVRAMSRVSLAQSTLDASRRRAADILAALVGSCLVGAVVLAVALTRSITRPIVRAAAAAQSIRSGDLTAHIELAGRDETGQLLRAMSDMQAALRNIVGGVRANSENVATAAAQIAEANVDLSSRTEDQASVLEAAASSMELLGANVEKNLDQVRRGDQLTRHALEVAGLGGQVVANVIDTMKGIRESSAKVVDIIGVIDSIAFKTNILSLNAAVEAARAGSQGRGFAVVAEEVRALAQSSARAATEIKSLITASVERVEKGVGFVDKAGSTMNQVVAATRDIGGIMAQISEASMEQGRKVLSVREAVVRLNQTTQCNAALVEQTAAAAASLSGQAHQLVDSVAQFRLMTDQAVIRTAEDEARGMDAAPRRWAVSV